MNCLTFVYVHADYLLFLFCRPQTYICWVCRDESISSLCPVLLWIPCCSLYAGSKWIVTVAFVLFITSLGKQEKPNKPLWWKHLVQGVFVIIINKLMYINKTLLFHLFSACFCCFISLIYICFVPQYRTKLGDKAYTISSQLKPADVTHKLPVVCCLSVVLLCYKCRHLNISTIDSDNLNVQNELIPRR